MASPSFKRTSVFISYSHIGARFFDQLVEHLAYYERNNLLKVWSDKKITPGAQWREEIRQAIEYTAVAVLLISPSYLASMFIADNELPPLLHAAEKEGAIILPVIVRPSYFEDTELANFQAVNSPSMPVARMKGYERDAFWIRVVREIRRAVTPLQTPNTAIENRKVGADVLIQTTFQPNVPSSPPLEEQIAQWMQARGSNSTQTTITYQFLITQFRSFLQKHGLDLNSEDVSVLTAKSQEWAAYAVMKPAVKPRTYNQRLSIISSFYSFALTQGWMKFNPIDEVQRREENTADGAKPLHIEKVKNALKSIPLFTLNGKRDYAMLCILFTTGCHAAEVANLRCGHIVKTKNSIAITTRQKGGKDRRYTLKKYTAQALIKYLTAIYDTECSPDAPVWLSFARNETKGFALGKSAISDICKKWLGTSKIEVTYRTFEAIQKKYGQIGLEDIEKLLGIEEKDNESS